MSVVLYTYDWLPDFPRGFVRDLRVRWALEETGRAYAVATVPARPKSDGHRAMQPFAQVPIIRDGDLTLFESGAIALYLAEGTPLLPEDRRAEVTQWLIAALNSVEAASGGWMGLVLAERMPEFFGPPSTPDVVERARRNMKAKLDALETLMSGREWIAGAFSVADIMMVDVLRIPDVEGQLSGYPALADYVARATARPAFRKAMDDHMAHWRAADEARQMSRFA
ncbi:glutathione S-transferase family protein [Shinella daejeonensis]|uniref:glutathione S-transferase family protein n=1 Tax=Shinella daejeonensis TaxID=659017 RepID=UPI0020C7B7CD|nr:glutathione S-transferase family protein [Shinella daejeonensis]MCP8894912.1 glutathione S-transferase family protein [Shinella daejeonensis]